MQEIVSFQTLFNIAFTLLGVVAGVVMTRALKTLDDLKESDDKLRDEVAGLKLSLVSGYFSKEDVKELITDIKAAVSRIEEKLDAKVDKKLS